MVFGHQNPFFGVFLKRFSKFWKSAMSASQLDGKIHGFDGKIFPQSIEIGLSWNVLTFPKIIHF